MIQIQLMHMFKLSRIFLLGKKSVNPSQMEDLSDFAIRGAYGDMNIVSRNTSQGDVLYYMIFLQKRKTC